MRSIRPLPTPGSRAPSSTGLGGTRRTRDRRIPLSAAVALAELIAGSSENTYSPINSDGTVRSWLGATGSNTIGTPLGYNLYNQAAIAFTDATGRGHPP